MSRSLNIMCIRITGIILLSLAVIPAVSQEVGVRGGFITDKKVRIGEETLFYLSSRSGRHQQVVFPDSSYNFGPFELLRKDYFNTITKDSISIDSAVYHLTTFEVDSIQSLRLPVFSISARDCTSYFSEADSITLEQMVKRLPVEISANLPVRATIAYQKVSTIFNYPVVIISLTLLVALSAVLWFSFGDRVRRHIRVRRLRRNHDSFVKAFDEKILTLNNEFSRKQAEDALVLWKQYMESINRLPYTRLTTKEILMAGRDQPVAAPLHKLDSVIYGYDERLDSALSELKDYTESRFQELLNNEANG